MSTKTHKGFAKTGIGIPVRMAAAICLVAVLPLAEPAAQVAAAAEADVPLAETTPRELAATVREAMKAYEAGVIEATYVESRVRDDLQPPETVLWEGRLEYASDGYRWHGEYEGQSYSMGRPGLYPRGWYAGFDGEVHFRRQLNDAFVLGEQQAHEGTPLLELFWTSHGASFAESLAEDDWELVGEETIGEQRCYVLVREVQLPNSRQRQELTLSPRQNHLPVRYKVFSNGELSWSHELLDLSRTETGVWYPQKIRKVQAWLSNRIVEASVVRYESDPFFDAAYFRPRIPWGIPVQDWRTGEIYKTDPWWAEVKPLVAAHAVRPPDFSPLDQIVSHADPAMEGQLPPPLAVSEWIQGGPVDLEQRRGKVTLLFFSGGSLWSPNPQWVSGLRELHKVYRPHGLEIVGINTHTGDVDAAKQQVEELRIGWPVAVDAEGGSFGQTFEAFGLQTYMSVVLLDHDGKVHLVQQGGLPAKIKELLEAAGEEQVSIVSLRNEPPTYPKELSDAWRAIVQAADRPAKIVGRVTDMDGPLAGAQVDGTLRLELAGTNTAGTHLFPYRDETFRATTGEEGAYEIGNVCKGVYTLRFELPGRAAIEKRVVLAPGETELVADADLTQPDGIRGRVVDEAGNPIDGAKVSIRHRHFRPDDLSFESTYNADPSVTDAEGRFHFENLLTGAYTLDVSHDEFLAEVLEHVPAGEVEAVVKLVKRSDDPE